MQTELKALALATCRALGVRTQEELDRLIQPQFPAHRIRNICEELEKVRLVTAAGEDREWDNIFATCIELNLNYSTPEKEHLLLIARLSEIAPIACLRWMVTNSNSAFAKLDPPLTIIEGYIGPIPPELETVANETRDILRRNRYLMVEPKDLKFSVLDDLSEPAENARPITGASFFFGWDFLR